MDGNKITNSMTINMNGKSNERGNEYNNNKNFEMQEKIWISSEYDFIGLMKMEQEKCYGHWENSMISKWSATESISFRLKFDLFCTFFQR